MVFYVCMYARVCARAGVRAQRVCVSVRACVGVGVGGCVCVWIQYTMQCEITQF
jgi:hypothetical protein